MNKHTDGNILAQKVTDWPGDEHRALLVIHEQLTRSLADLRLFMLQQVVAGELLKVVTNVRDYRAFFVRDMADLEDTAFDVALAARNGGDE